MNLNEWRKDCAGAAQATHRSHPAGRLAGGGARSAAAEGGASLHALRRKKAADQSIHQSMHQILTPTSALRYLMIDRSSLQLLTHSSLHSFIHSLTHSLTHSLAHCRLIGCIATIYPWHSLAGRGGDAEGVRSAQLAPRDERRRRAASPVRTAATLHSRPRQLEKGESANLSTHPPITNEQTNERTNERKNERGFHQKHSDVYP